MTKKYLFIISAIAVIALALISAVSYAQESPQGQYGWLAGSWKYAGKQLVKRNNFQSNYGPLAFYHDYIVFVRSGNIIEAYDKLDMNQPFGLRALVTDGGLQWQRLGAQIVEGGKWLPVSVSVSPDQRTISYQYEGYSGDGIKDSVFSFSLTKE